MEATERDEWVAAARAGDVEALGAVYRLLAPRVLGYLRLRGAQDPEALTNDVFIEVIQRIGSTRGGWADLRAHVFTVARRRLVDEFRRRSRRGVDVAYEPEADTRMSPSAEEAGLAILGARDLVDLLDLLPEAEKDVVVLRVLGELSIAETAAVVSHSPATVSRVQRQALERLRGLLATDETTGLAV